MGPPEVSGPRPRGWVAAVFLAAWSAPVLLAWVWGEAAVMRLYGGLCLALVALIVALDRSPSLRRVVFHSDARPAPGAVRLCCLLGVAFGAGLVAASYLLPGL